MPLLAATLLAAFLKSVRVGARRERPTVMSANVILVKAEVLHHSGNVLRHARLAIQGVIMRVMLGGRGLGAAAVASEVHGDDRVMLR